MKSRLARRTMNASKSNFSDGIRWWIQLAGLTRINRFHCWDSQAISLAAVGVVTVFVRPSALDQETRGVADEIDLRVKKAAAGCVCASRLVRQPFRLEDRRQLQTRQRSTFDQYMLSVASTSTYWSTINHLANWSTRWPDGGPRIL